MAEPDSSKAPQSDKPRVSLVLTGGEEQEERWEEAVEERYGTMAELVRTSVEREIEGHHDAPEPRETASADSELVGEVLTAVRQVQATLEDMDSRIGHLERQSETSGPKYDLQRVVLELLPAQEVEHIPDPFLPENYGIDCVTAEGLADRIGAEESEVSDTLERIEDTFKFVRQEAGEDGTVYYWKEA